MRTTLVGRAALSIFAPVGLPEIRTGDDIAALTAAALKTEGQPLLSGDVVVFAQKIVSKAEGRRVALNTVTPSAEAAALGAKAQKDPRLVELILRESQAVVRCVPGVIIVRHRLGFVMANAGVDQSNVGDDDALLLPEHPDESAQRLRETFRTLVGGDVAVVINDSFGRAWRYGTCGVAIGSAGLTALRDLRGVPDRAGRALQVTEVGVADEVAAAASVLMGQAGEGRPVAVLRGLDPALLGEGRAADLIRSPTHDLFP